MPKIWRVENDKGQGPYRILHDYSDCDSVHPLEAHNWLNGHPSPYSDVGIKRCPKFYEICGFLNKEMAYNWFNELEFDCMANDGFYLKEIEVYQITAIGEYQVLAIREEKDIPEIVRQQKEQYANNRN